MKPYWIEHKTKKREKRTNTFKDVSAACPFCNWEALKKEHNVYEEGDNWLFIDNKYPAFNKEDGDCYVFVETRDCKQNLSTYNDDYIIEMFRFLHKKWISFLKDDSYQSVMFFKNQGALSSGSIRHSHMQMIPLKKRNVFSDLKKEFFDGQLVEKDKRTRLTLSTDPISEFYEWNIETPLDGSELSSFCYYLKRMSQYIGQTHGSKASYNLAFYPFGGFMHCKIILRTRPSSVLLLAYNLKQVPNNLEDEKRELKEFLMRYK